MKRNRRFAVVLAACCLGFSFRAGSCAHPPPPSPALRVSKAFERASDVFEGRFKSGRPTGTGMDWETTFEKLQTWKGGSASEIKTVTTHSTCAPYPYWDRPQGSARGSVSYQARSDEPAVLIFYDGSRKEFLKVETDASSKKELKALAARSK